MDDRLYRICVREKRRQAISYSVLVVAVSAALGFGWLSASLERDAWREQNNVWQEQYQDLYEDYTERLGELPPSVLLAE